MRDMSSAEKITQDLNNNNIPASTKQNTKSPRKPQHRQHNNENAVVNGGENRESQRESSGNQGNNVQQTMKVGKEAVAGLPNENALLELMEKTGYQLTHHNGQRKFGPPPNWTGEILSFL